MKTPGESGLYVSGPHSSDYYLLLDDQSECLFAARLAERIREANDVCEAKHAWATASLLEMWIDDGEMRVWYLFGGALSAPASATSPLTPPALG